MNLGCPAIVWSDETHEGRRKVKIDAGGLHRLHAVRPGLSLRLHPAGGVVNKAFVEPAASTTQPRRARQRRGANVMVVGVGGQGVLLISKALALIGQKQGFEVKQSEVHGMAKRGGVVFSHVRFGAKVWSPTIAKGEADALIALEWAEGLRWLDYLRPDTGLFIADTRRIVPPFACRDRRRRRDDPIRARDAGRDRRQGRRRAMRSTRRPSPPSSASRAPPTPCCSACSRPR